MVEWVAGISVKAPTPSENEELDDGRGTKRDRAQGAAQTTKQMNLTTSDVQSWADSFERLMSSITGQKVFREFLKCEYSEENILFWLAVEELKQEIIPELVEEKARLIYEDYVSILSPREVSLDSRVREKVNKNMMTPNQHTFDEAQLQIYTLMHRDSYSRFVNSVVYKQALAQKEEGEEGQVQVA